MNSGYFYFSFFKNQEVVKRNEEQKILPEQITKELSIRDFGFD